MTLYADLAALEDLVARLAAFEADAEETAADVEREVRQLHLQWTGRAAQEHLEAHDAWCSGAERMRTAVAELRRAVAAAHTNYAAAVAAGSRMWG